MSEAGYRECLTRRNFLRTGVTALSASVLVNTQAASRQGTRSGMFKTLGVGHIGVRASQFEALDYAVRFGFGGINVHADELERMDSQQRREVLTRMKTRGLQWGVSSLPVRFRTTDEEFRRTLALLPSRAKVLAELGAIRVCTWISPGHDSLTYRRNFEQHRSRLTEVARILKGQGLKLGLEFVGPKPSRDRSRFPFIHTLEEQLELNDAIGADNVGVLLDSYHWFTSGGSVSDIEKLTGKQVIEVHVNDALTGLPVDQLPDGKRALPCSTGVIDLQGFMTALRRIDYAGPVTCEPFDRKLNDLDDELALKQTSEALDRLFALIGE
jgi:2-keto-myo-inositol isomerase